MHSNISKHITYKEATFSSKAVANGIENIPDANHLIAMKLVAEKCFEPLREWYGKPIRINSFYRNPATNREVKGSSTSDHMKGCAIDLTAGSIGENRKLFEWAKANLKFTQLINEYNFSWIHISYVETNLKNQILVIK
jgi:zinc D-Ala-D-Ala carboxypeptidase